MRIQIILIHIAKTKPSVYILFTLQATAQRCRLALGINALGILLKRLVIKFI